MEAPTKCDQAFGRQRLIVKHHHGLTEFRVIAPRPWQLYASPALGVIALVRHHSLFAHLAPHPLALTLADDATTASDHGEIRSAVGQASFKTALTVRC